MRRYVEVRAQIHWKLVRIDDLECHQTKITGKPFQLLPKEIIDDRDIVKLGIKSVLMEPFAHLAITMQGTMFGRL